MPLYHHVVLRHHNCYMDVTCITRRKDAIFMNYINQLAPSESSVRSRVTKEGLYLKELKAMQIGVFALSDDIDPENLDAVMWSMAFRFKPHLDLKVHENWAAGHGPRDIVRGDADSALLINAVLKHDMAPVALPKREYMERAREIWEKDLGWAPLKPETPWCGYSLGAWTEQLEREAMRAVKGDQWETGRIAAKRRRKDIAMNTEVRFVDDSDSQNAD